MQFESKQQRMQCLNLALNSIPDLFVSLLLTLLFGGGALGFLFALIGLQARYLAIWMKNTIWAWIAFKTYSRKYLVKVMNAYLSGVQLAVTKSHL
jgi:hypothetical protein